MKIDDKDILKAVKIFIQYPEADDKSIVSIFEDHSIQYPVSVYLLIFIPIAFARIVCKKIEINFTDEYVEHQTNGSIKEGHLSKNLAFLQVYEFSENILESGLDSDIILQIARRSPEFKIINESLLKEVEVNKIVFSPLHIVL